MWPIFILILVVVGAFALWFNYWNHKNPVGAGRNKNKQNLQAPSTKSTEQEWMDIIKKNREEHERENEDLK